MKKNFSFSLWTLLFLIIISACNLNTKPPLTITYSTISEEIPTATFEPALATEIAPSPTGLTIPSDTELENTKLNINQPLSHYQITVNFDYGLQSAKVTQLIDYQNGSQNPLNFILLACDPLREKDLFHLNSLSVNDQLIDAEIGNFWLKIPLHSPLLLGEKVSISLDYDLNLPAIPTPADDRKPVIFGYTQLQSNFVDWYPMVVPRDENGNWVLHDPWFYGEYLVYPLSSFNINIQISNSPATIVLAASLQANSINGSEYHFQTDMARNFVFSVSPSYLNSQEKIGDIVVTSYYFPFHKTAGEQVLRETVNAIKLYSTLFGEYPRKSLTVVEADFLDGMEFDGFYFLSRGFYNLYDGTSKGYLTTIAVHETSHQWWYTSVANDQALEPWLDEALCTFSESLFYENVYPDLINWWWSYRVDFYQPDGYINSPIYDYQGFVPYRNAVYLQGAKFFQNLRETMGDIAFFDFIKEYANTFRNEISTTDRFWELAQEYSSSDLTSLRNQYFK